MKVYIAGPYTIGDVARNVRKAITVADMVRMFGHLPFVPHLTHFWHLISPHPYDYWIKMDNEWLLECDAVIRFPGESAGADAEVNLAIDHDIPVFYSVDEWAGELR